MAKSDEQVFFELLTALAATTQNFVLTDPVLATYERILKPLGYANLNRALEAILLEKSSRDPFPSIADIRAKLSPELDPAQEAQLIVGKIIYAISKIGPYRASEARAFMGELGWQVVEMSGGWDFICCQTDDRNIGTFRAQWIRLCESLRTMPSLPEPRRQIGEKGPATDTLLGFGEVMKMIRVGHDYD